MLDYNSFFAICGIGNFKRLFCGLSKGGKVNQVDAFKKKKWDL